MTDQPTKRNESAQNSLLSEPAPVESVSQTRAHAAEQKPREQKKGEPSATATIGGAVLTPGHPISMWGRDSYKEARRLLEESLEIYKQLGDQIGIANTWQALGTLAQKLNSYKEARELYQASLEVYEQFGDLPGVASTLYALGTLVYNQSYSEEARLLLQKSQPIWQPPIDPQDKSSLQPYELNPKDATDIVETSVVAANLAKGDLASVLSSYAAAAERIRQLEIDKPNKHFSVNINRQSAFVHALLQRLIRDTQEAKALAQVIGVPLSSIQNWITGIALPTEEEQRHLWDIYLERVSSSQEQPPESSVQVHILEEPLTLSTLTTAFSALTELSTKYWLIAQGRFADLLEYTQTHDERFVQEAGITIGKISHNSPFDISINLSAKNVAEAVTTTIDGIVQARSRLAQKELEVLAQAQALELATQRAQHEQQMATIEREIQQLALEQQRVDILSQQLELQKKAVEYSLELARTAVNILQPGLDPAARAMAMQAVLPNILQLQQIAGLKIVLPSLPSVQEEKDESESTEST